jgi:hypothetical protein
MEFHRKACTLAPDAIAGGVRGVLLDFSAIPSQEACSVGGLRGEMVDL